MYNNELVVATRNFKEKLVVTNNNAKSENSIGYEMTAQLLPFKFTMKKQLKRRGYNVDFMPFKSIIVLYYNEFVSNKNNSTSNLVPINEFEFINNPAFRIRLSDEINGDIFSHQSRAQFNKVASIVDNIINTFSAARLKKQSLGLGNFDVQSAMTDDEITQANAAIRIEKDLQNKLNGSAPFTMKNFKTFLFVGLAIYLFWYMTK